jgi:hypothetical protein
VQRPMKGLWAGLWELPSEPVAAGETIEAARARLRERLPVGLRLGTREKGCVTRQLTHRTVTFHVYRGTVKRGGGDGAAGRWLRPGELKGVGLSRATEAILRCASTS